MKISMILTSLIVAMSATSLTGCDYAGETDATKQSPEVIEKAEEMEDEATDALKPVTPAE